MDIAAGMNAMSDVSRSRKEALFETLSGILSPVQDIRRAAEERVKALEVTEGYYRLYHALLTQIIEATISACHHDRVTACRTITFNRFRK